jgi:hypothetical protein
MNETTRRVPGWVIVLVVTAFVAAVGAVILLTVPR